MPAIQIAHSIVAGHQPILQLPGQIAINEADGILYARDTSGNALPLYLGLPGTLLGCNTSNNGGAPTSSIDITAGVAAADTSPYIQMALSSTLTKNLTVAWAVGSGNGGLDTGAVGNGTYHLFLIRRPDTGVADALFSLSPTSPSMPANYTQKRRIASIGRTGGANVLYSQLGDEFLLKVPVNDVFVGNLGTSATLYTLSVPTGIQVVSLLNGYAAHTGGTDVLITSPDQTDSVASDSVSTLHLIDATEGSFAADVRTNTSAQIRARSNQSSTTFIVYTRGWTDIRGRS
jgi:hypothetical protein